VSGYSRLKKHDLIFRLLKANAEQQGYIFGAVRWILCKTESAFFARGSCCRGQKMFTCPQSQIRRFALRTGDQVLGQVRPAKENEKYFGLLRVEAVNGLDPDGGQTPPTSSTV